MSIAASNDYVAACKNFGNWLTKTRPRRWPENPLSPVGKLNSDEDDDEVVHVTGGSGLDE